MMTLSADIEEKAATYCMEALGRMRVALAGSPPNGFISLMCDYYGYKGEEPVASTTSTVPPPTIAAQPTSGTSGRQFVPTSLMPVDPSTFLDPQNLGVEGKVLLVQGALKNNSSLLTRPAQLGLSPVLNRRDGPAPGWQLNTCLPMMMIYIFAHCPSATTNGKI